MCNYICFMQKYKNTTQSTGLDHLPTMVFDQLVFEDESIQIYSLSQEKALLKDQLYIDDDFVILLQGTFYNFDDLVSDLRMKQEIQSEGELVKELYNQSRIQFLNQIQGKFSLILWNKQEKKLYGANDRFGVKSLFYTSTEEGMYFSTQKKPLMLLREENQVAKGALQHYLSFQYVPEPLSMTKDIFKLESGHYFYKSIKKTLIKKKYWQAAFQPMKMEKQKLMKEIRQVLFQSIKRHIQDAEQIGTFLSGGIDSAIIASVLKEFTPHFKTFSVGFDYEGYSEIEIANETAKALGVKNYYYRITAEEFVRETSKIIWYLEDPLADPSCIPLYFAANLAKNKVDTVLSGEAADELFAGYNIYREPKSLKIFNVIPRPAKGILKRLAHMLPDEVKGKSFLLRGTTPLEERYIGNAKIFEEEEKEPLLKQFDPNLSYQEITAPFYKEAKDYSPVHQMQYIDLHTWLRGDILLKADKMSVANDLDIRMPFLDKEVFNVASKISEDLKIADGTTKKILREAVRGIVPDHVLSQKKLGFPVPIRHWLKNELYDWAKYLIKESATDDLIRKSEVYRLLDQHCLGKVDLSRKIWTILIFMEWHQLFIEGKGLQQENVIKRLGQN